MLNVRPATRNQNLKSGNDVRDCSLHGPVGAFRFLFSNAALYQQFRYSPYSAEHLPLRRVVLNSDVLAANRY